MKRLIPSGIAPDFIQVLLIPLLIASICSISKATVIHVPADKSTVQAGVDSADFGDTVLVAPGTYVENILLDNKSIVLTSNFMFDNDPSFIYSTILDGSSPAHPDTGSVLRLIGFSVDSTTVVQGFTITNGNGTVWTDEHGAGVYREGGGILTTYSSPIIRYNLIINNQATQGGAGITSAGGGAIRSGDGNPRILNNMILYNQGRYGAGIVLNFAYGVITNNVIAYNTGGQDYAGGGIWKYGNGANGGVALIENNTIAYNNSILPGGGVFIWNTSATLINNLIWGNVAPSEPQIGKNGATIVARNCNVQGGYTGTDNIDSNPFMFGNYLYTSSGSPCIDTGDTAVAYSDIEDPGNSGFSIWPSFGTLRNDIGAYGGPEAFSFEPVAAYADSTIGWAPMPVNFEGYTALSANSWHWDFGDDSTGTGQTPPTLIFSAVITILAWWLIPAVILFHPYSRKLFMCWLIQ